MRCLIYAEYLFGDNKMAVTIIVIAAIVILIMCVVLVR
jgi:uncharacterized membrane protein